MVRWLVTKCWSDLFWTIFGKDTSLAEVGIFQYLSVVVVVVVVVVVCTWLVPPFLEHQFIFGIIFLEIISQLPTWISVALMLAYFQHCAYKVWIKLQQS